MITIFLIISAVAVIKLFFYVNGLYYEKYWTKRGVKYYKKNKNLGIFWDFIFKNKSTIECANKIYDKYRKEPAVGIGCLCIPGLFVTNPENSMYVLENEAFNYRAVYINKHDILASNNILLMHGVKWKLLRQKFSRLFTTSKLKEMFPSINEIATEFVEHLKTHNVEDNNTGLIMKEYGGAAVTASIFGVKFKRTFDPTVVNQVRLGFSVSIEHYLRIAIGIAIPFITKLFRLKLHGKAEKFFMSATRQIISQATKGCSERGRGFQDLYKKMQESKILKDDETGTELKVTDEMIAGNIFNAISASVELIGTVLFGALYELAKNPDIQQKMRNEIDEAFEKCGGNFTYETLLEMKYLEKVYCEAIRMYPAISFIFRSCVKDTVLPVGNIKVDKGTFMLIPTFQHHYDQEYVEDPHVFNPERFNDLILEKSPIFKPFGGGKRLCLAIRYSKITVKTALLQIIRNYQVETIPGKDKIKYLRSIFSMQLRNIPLKFKLR